MRYKLGILFLIYIQIAFCVTQDSIGVVEQNGKKFILHLVEKETLFSISKKYNISLNELKTLNPELSQGLKIGQKLLIPAKVFVDKTELLNQKNENFVLHKVEPSQTLYAISKKYAAKIDDIKRWNSLETNELKVGSYIIVGEKSKLDVANNVDLENRNLGTNVQLQELGATQKNSIKKSEDGKTTEKLVATIFETNDGNKFYFALHKTAPVGTILKISNQQNDNSIFARVSGKQSELEKGIKLSKIAYEKLQLNGNNTVLVEYIAP